MNKKLTGPTSSARVLSLSQQQITKSKIQEVSEQELRQCQGGLRVIVA